MKIAVYNDGECKTTYAFDFKRGDPMMIVDRIKELNDEAIVTVLYDHESRPCIVMDGNHKVLLEKLLKEFE